MATEHPLGHIASEMCLVLSLLLAVPGIDTSLLLGRPRLALQTLSFTVSRSRQHQSLLVLPDRMQTTDQFSIVEKVSPRSKVD